MSVDEIGRQAGLALRTSVSRDTDVDGSYAELRGRSRRRRVRITASALSAAVTASVLAVTWQGVQEPADPVAPPATDPRPATRCSDNEAVTCPTPEQVRVAGPSAYEVTLPPGFQLPPEAPRAPAFIDFFQRDTEAGVTVVQDAVGLGSRTASVSARRLASWIASRPFLDTAGPRRTELDGTTAWVVQARPAQVGSLETPDAADTCNETQPGCRALLRSGMDPDRWEVGTWSGMVARFYCIDTPRAGVTVVWSWAFDGGRRALDANEALVGSFTTSPRP